MSHSICVSVFVSLHLPKKWTQTRLSSFVKKRKTTAVDQEDTENRKLGASEVETPTEGQL